MDEKTFKVGFYQAEYGDKDTSETIGDCIQEWAKIGHSPSRKLYNINYELRHLESINKGKVIRGEFAKFRDDDLPHIGQVGGDERKIELLDEEGLIEKNYFIFYRKYELFVYQQNGNGSTSNQLGKYLTDATGETTTLNPVLQPEAMKRLLRSEVRPKMVEVSFARPRNAELISSDNWTNEVFDILNRSGANNAFIRVSLGKGPKNRFLKQGIKNSVRDLIRKSDVSVARVKVDDDGFEHTIDLIEDRIQAEITIPMLGRYPDPQHVHQELGRAYREQEKLIKSVLGGDNVLV